MLRNSFHRQHRMVEAESYKRVFAKARWRSGGAEFLLLARPNNLAHARLGLVIGKKNQPRAVDRNLTKRVVRESFRQALPELPAADIIVLSRPGIRKATRKIMSEQVRFHLLDIQRNAQQADNHS